MKHITALPLARASALAAAVVATALLVLVLLGPVAPASAHHIWKRCQNVEFSPNSDNVAAAIRVRRVPAPTRATSSATSTRPPPSVTPAIGALGGSWTRAIILRTLASGATATGRPWSGTATDHDP